jgi:hypothetical protein
MSLSLKKAAKGPSQAALNALANRVHLEELLEPVKWKAIAFFQSSGWIRPDGKLAKQPALLPTEDLSGLTDAQVEYVIQHLDYFRLLIEATPEDTIPM